MVLIVTCMSRPKDPPVHHALSILNDLMQSHVGKLVAFVQCNTIFITMQFLFPILEHLQCIKYCHMLENWVMYNWWPLS